MLHFLLSQGIYDEIAFTVTPASSKVLTLCSFTAPYAAQVDWGDGSFSHITSRSDVSHTYADATARQVKIRGALGGFWNIDGAPGKDLVTSLDVVKSRSLVTMERTFYKCTRLTTLPATLDAPNVTKFNWTFFFIRSVTSALPPLWTSHPSATRTNCFTRCMKSCYAQYGSACPHKKYVPAVQQQTYFQRYGTSACPAASYVAGSPATLAFDYYGFGKCPYYVFSNYAGVPCRNHSSTTVGQHNYCSKRGPLCPLCTTASHTGTCVKTECDHSVGGSSSYYNCTHFGGTCKGSSCTRIFQSGQSGYDKCLLLDAECLQTDCDYPYANAASYDTAKSKGWA